MAGPPALCRGVLMKDLDVEELKQQAICWRCVEEPYFRAEIKKNGEKRECRYCNEEAATFTLEEAADAIEAAFESHYTRTATDMDGLQWAMHKDPEMDYEWEREGEPTVDAIGNATPASMRRLRRTFNLSSRIGMTISRAR